MGVLILSNLKSNVCEMVIDSSLFQSFPHEVQLLNVVTVTAILVLSS